MPGKKTRRQKLVRTCDNKTERMGVCVCVVVLCGAARANHCGGVVVASCTGREVKRATRELNQQISKLDPMEKKIDYLIKRCSELVADLRRVTRDNKNNKCRADNLQKDKDVNRAELTKTVGLKDKLEKLCRELQRDNNKLKVRDIISLDWVASTVPHGSDANDMRRATIKRSKIQVLLGKKLRIKNLLPSWASCKAGRRTKTAPLRKQRSATWTKSES